MATFVMHQPILLPWSRVPEESKRFNRIVIVCLLAYLFGSVIVPWIKTESNIITPAVLPPKAATLKLNKPKPIIPPPPPPKPIEVPKPEPKPEPPKPVEAPKPQPKPEPKPEPKPTPKPPEPPKPKPQPRPAEPVVSKAEQAREKAAKSGLLALSDQLADLRQSVDTTQLSNNAPTIAAAEAAASNNDNDAGIQRALIGAVGKTSGGIGSAGKASQGIAGKLGGKSTGLSNGRKTTQVTSAQAGAAQGGGAINATTSSGGANGRSNEDIRKVFDRNKAAIYSLYNRALRENPSLKGKVVLELTIEASGKVSSCRLVSSELKNADLERKLVARVQLFDFGSRSAAKTKITWPIDFLPQ